MSLIGFFHSEHIINTQTTTFWVFPGHDYHFGGGTMNSLDYWQVSGIRSGEMAVVLHRRLPSFFV